MKTKKELLKEFDEIYFEDGYHELKNFFRKTVEAYEEKKENK